MDFGLLMELRDHLTIKHHVPGRIRLQFSVALLADPRARRLKGEAGETPPPFIKKTSFNLFQRMAVIEYDPEVVVPEKLHEALTTRDAQRFAELASEFETIITEEA
ncbi:hypothetical protein SAMN02745704_00128 [Paucidesulfovibrio gracilis DSM 16080]|uniref:Uncharacterized protein n=1 Tax=Paucidesulfovibrio gracilis DSM 16080 TaxID=1121449 RepID=A0A1T4W2T1_9BACT|nr:hypothetical protein [Paucidesulfovibrio gracilis]SKA71368.1 hypothetical protein SAMN02745704_00128 [Paucidesulfovibrio gracilis DSM 16080]